jgi:hypothetical protein
MSTTQTEAPFIGWLAHDEDNKVIVLYSGYGDTRKQQVKYVAGLIRRGLIVREITDAEKVRTSGCWGNVVPEQQLRSLVAAPVYDDAYGSAASCAEEVVAARDGRPDAEIR